ncbi:MAG: hypothetical protein RBR35_14025 [Salinivirgaceae bacterium]|nr:hypothetical protein [Salinivirgaceae bacterium]
MSDHGNGDGNITNNQNEEPTMTDTTTATTVSNNQDAVYAGAPCCWERSGPEPKIQLTAEHCTVTNARLVRRLDDQWATCFHLHLGGTERKAFQCIAFDEAHSDLEDGTLVTVTGYLHPFDWVEPSEVDPNNHMLIVESLREEVESLRVVQDAPTALPPGAKPW